MLNPFTAIFPNTNEKETYQIAICSKSVVLTASYHSSGAIYYTMSRPRRGASVDCSDDEPYQWGNNRGTSELTEQVWINILRKDIDIFYTIRLIFSYSRGRWSSPPR